MAGRGGATVTGQGGSATGAGGAICHRRGRRAHRRGRSGRQRVRRRRCATTGTDGGSTSGCTIGAWPAADPSVTGPFATTTENNVGPAAGQGADGGAPVAFTLFRPTDLAQGGLCHPVITWGNGTGTTPSIYRVLLTHLASHGFVVIASNSPNVAQGNPPPMVAGVTWVLQQNADPTSVMYQRIDTTHVGATGHSQGGFATTTAGAGLAHPDHRADRRRHRHEEPARAGAAPVRRHGHHRPLQHGHERLQRHHQPAGHAGRPARRDPRRLGQLPRRHAQSRRGGGHRAGCASS